MARTLTEIEEGLLTKKEELLPELSTSKTADWYLWITIFAYSIWLFEKVMDIFQADIESQLERKQPGTLEWYSEKALGFQLGDTLQVDKWGVIGYSITNESKRVVKHASVNENEGTLIIKVATIDEETNELKPLNLTNGEFLNFQRYMEKIKFAGTAVEYRTFLPDVVNYDVNVYYDPLYLPEDIQANVVTALATFRTDLSFDAMLYKSDFVNAIMAIEGVKTVKVNSMVVTPDDADPVVLDVVMELESGYFNYSNESVINMINANS